MELSVARQAVDRRVRPQGAAPQLHRAQQHQGPPDLGAQLLSRAAGHLQRSKKGSRQRR